MHLRRESMVLLLALSFLTAPPARAQEKDPIKLFNMASELAESGRMGEAIQIWVDIAEELPAKYQPVVQVNLGLAYKKFGKLPEAWHHLRLYLKISTEEDPDAIEWLAQVEASLKKTHARVAISSQPDGGLLYFGDKAEGIVYRCPLTWWLKPGKHTVFITKAGFEGKAVVINAGAAGSDALESVQLFTLEKTGMLMVKGPEVGAQVFIDGLLEGTVPFKRKLKSGTYELMVGRPGKPVWKKKITIDPGGEVVERPRLARTRVEETPEEKTPVGTDKTDGGKTDGGKTDGGKSSPDAGITKPGEKKKSNLWKWALVGGGGAVVAVGGIMQYLALAKNDDLKKQYPDSPNAPPETRAKYQEAYDSQVVPLSTTAYAMYGIGAAAAVTGVVLVVMGGGGDDGGKSARWFAPVPLGDGAGFVMGLEF